MWQIKFFNSRVEAEVNELPAGIRAGVRRIFGLMLEHGPMIGMPYTRSMGKDLFEIRGKGAEGIGRVFYASVVDHEILILHSFVKKTQKTPPHEMEIARRRLREVKNG